MSISYHPDVGFISRLSSFYLRASTALVEPLLEAHVLLIGTRIAHRSFH